LSAAIANFSGKWPQGWTVLESRQLTSLESPFITAAEKTPELLLSLPIRKTPFSINLFANSHPLNQCRLENTKGDLGNKLIFLKEAQLASLPLQYKRLKEGSSSLVHLLREGERRVREGSRLLQNYLILEKFEAQSYALTL
jgi:hypothetical protein